MITKITGEQPFQVLTNNFSISPSQEGYTLQISADGKQYSNLFSVGAGVTRLVTGVAANSYYRLLGNQSQVSVNWLKSCGGEGGGSGSGTELAPVTEFPLGAVEGTVVALVSGDTIGIYQYDGEEWNEAGADVDLSAYWTSAQTKTYVDSAVTLVEDHLFDVEEVTASALTELHDAVLELSGSSVDLSGYYTSGETDAAISAATAGKADAASVSASNGGVIPKWNAQGIITGNWKAIYEQTLWINSSGYKFYSTEGFSPRFYAPRTSGETGQIIYSDGTAAPKWITPATINGSAITSGGNIEIQGGGDMSQYWTSAQTKAYVDSADTVLQDQIDTMDDVVSAALVDLNDRKVESASVSTIWKGTQAEYDAATQSGATANPATLYIIVNNS